MGHAVLATAYLDWLYNALGSVIAFFYALVPSYAFAIAMLTISVRVVLIPLTAKQVKSQRAMQQLQPELKKLQAKYKGDRQTLNEEMMKLYKEHKANPLAGCLPLVLQMPLFIVLYRIIRSLSEVPPKHIPAGTSLYHALVASHGKLESFGVDLAHKPQSVVGLFMVAAVVGTGYFQQKQMTARLPKDSINPQMQMVTKVFPVFFGFISLSVPAGVVLYFMISNLWQIGQQAVAFRNREAAAARATPDEPEPEATGKPGRGGSGAPAKSGGSNPKGGAGGGGSTAKGGGAPAKGGGTPAKTGGMPAKSGGTPAKAGGTPAKGGGAPAKGGGTPAKAGGTAAKGGGGSKGSGTPRSVPAKSQGGGGSNRPPSGRVTPKGGGKTSGRVTPKGGPAGAANAAAGQRGAKSAPKSASPTSSAGRSSAGESANGSSNGEESRWSRLFPMNRAAKAKRPPPAARPKGLPPTKGSSGGSSRKET